MNPMCLKEAQAVGPTQSRASRQCALMDCCSPLRIMYFRKEIRTRYALLNALSSMQGHLTKDIFHWKNYLFAAKHTS